MFLLLALLAPWQADRVAFRIITVPSESTAAELRARIVAGESFESVAREYSTDASKSAGGFMGVLALADLRQELRTGLSALAPGELSPVFKMGSDFVLLQSVAPDEVDWINEDNTAADLLQKRRYAEAVKPFTKAVQLAEKFGVDDDRLGQSLNGLAEAYWLQDDFAGASTVYRRILSIRWGSPQNKGDGAVSELVDRFTDVLALSYFRVNQFQEALKKYQDALIKVPAGEALYIAMTALLVKAELTAEAADLMDRAVHAFPSSRRVRYKEAEMHRDSGRMRKALETFQQASQMKAPAGMSPERDRAQLSFIYQRIGGINTDLDQFDDAIAAYKKALDVSPENADARVALGDIFLRRGQHSEALAEYKRVATTHAEKALPHYRLADASLQMGNFAEAAAEAATALKIDSKQRKARYVNGTALMRLGRIEEGRNELQEYQRQENEAQNETNNQRDVVVSNRAASELALKGQTDAAIASFRQSVEVHASAASLRLNLAVALNMAGRPREAVGALQTLFESGVSDDFVVYRTLARAYESLKDEKAAQKYNAMYVRKVDAALEQELQ